MRMEEISKATGIDIESTRTALLDLQEDELVFLRNGWYTASAVARQKFA
jgi:predicted transcriptional regulator